MKNLTYLVMTIGLVGCGSLALQPLTYDNYSSSIAHSQVSMASRTSVTGMPKKVNKLIVVDVVYTADFNGQTMSLSGSQYSQVTPVWHSKATSANLQDLANTLGKKCWDKLGALGLNMVMVDESKHQGVGTGARNEIGNGYSFVSDKMFDYSSWKTNEILAGNGGDAVLFVRARGKWSPVSLAKLNDEPVINYDVANNVEVRLCTSNQDCTIMKISEPAERQADVQLPVTADHYKNFDKFVENNKWTQEKNAEIIADAIFGQSDKLFAK